MSISSTAAWERFGIDGLTAFLVEVGKSGGKLTVGLPFLCDDFCQAVPNFGYNVFELRDGFFPFVVCLWAVVKEGLEYIDELGRVS